MGENQLRSARYVFPAKRLCFFFDQHQTHNKSADFFFRSIFPPKDLYIFFDQNQYETIWKRRLFSIRLERFLVKILICKFIEFSLPGNY